MQAASIALALSFMLETISREDQAISKETLTPSRAFAAGLI